MKCRKCRDKAVIKLYQHNLPLCRQHFLEFVQERVKKAVHDFKMMKKGDRILLVASGGKDSLTLGYILKELGYNIHILHLNLGIGEYSEKSERKCVNFCEKFSLPFSVVSLKEEWRKGIGGLAPLTYKSTCSLCGMIKRYYFNKVAYEEGFDMVATGHNLDDMSSALLANLLGWRTSFLVKQTPVLEEAGKLKRKVKPLIYLTERETAAFAFLSGIDYVKEECPYSRDSSFLRIKYALNRIERDSPGTKYSFYRGLLENLALFQEKEKGPQLQECAVCGFPTVNDICSFCKTLRREEVREYASRL